MKFLPRANGRLVYTVLAWAACSTSLATWAQPSRGQTPTICREQNVEIIVGGVKQSAAHPCAKDDGPPRIRVPSPLQRERDVERLRILQHELAQEEAALASLRQEVDADPSSVSRKSEDVAALRRAIQSVDAAGQRGARPRE